MYFFAFEEDLAFFFGEKCEVLAHAYVKARVPFSSALADNDSASFGELTTVQLFSALKHDGHKELTAVLDAWMTQADAESVHIGR